METNTFEEIHFNELKSEVTIGNRYSHLTFFTASDKVSLVFTCNKSGDYDNSVMETVPLDLLKEFNRCIKTFGPNNIITIKRPQQNLEMDIGYDITNNIEIFFELIDYDYDASQGASKKTYAIDVQNGTTEYRVLKEVLDFLLKNRDKREKKDGEEHEYQLHSAEHQRTSRF